MISEESYKLLDDLTMVWLYKQLLIMKLRCIFDTTSTLQLHYFLSHSPRHYCVTQER